MAQKGQRKKANQKEKAKKKETKRVMEKERTKGKARAKALRQGAGSVKVSTMPPSAQKASPKAKARPHQPTGSVRKKDGIHGVNRKSL